MAAAVAVNYLPPTFSSPNAIPDTLFHSQALEQTVTVSEVPASFSPVSSPEIVGYDSTPIAAEHGCIDVLGEVSLFTFELASLVQAE